MAMLTPALGAKRLELLHELVPKVTVVGVLLNANHPIVESQLRDLQETAHAIGQKIKILRASTERDIDVSLAELAQQRDNALLIAGDAFFTDRRKQLIALAAQHAIPLIYQWREFVIDGGLISYGPGLTDAYRRVGIYTGRILRGEKPADLPVQQPTGFELVVNLKTANALGLEIPCCWPAPTM